MRCSICRHPERKAIDAALLQGERFRDLARRTAVGKDSLVRHRDHHLLPRLAKSQKAEAIASADALAAKLAEIEMEARRLGSIAEDAGDLRTALQALREWTRVVELGARLSGHLRGEHVSLAVNITAETAAKMAQVFLARRERQAIDIS